MECPPSILKDTFINGLGLEFSSIRDCMDDLPAAWTTDNFDSLITTAHNYLNNILENCQLNKSYHDAAKSKPPPTDNTKPPPTTTKPDLKKIVPKQIPPLTTNTILTDW